MFVIEVACSASNHGYRRQPTRPIAIKYAFLNEALTLSILRGRLFAGLGAFGLATHRVHMTMKNVEV